MQEKIWCNIFYLCKSVLVMLFFSTIISIDASAANAIEKRGYENAAIIFEPADFEENNLKEIKILRLPDHGMLKLSKENVCVNQEIPIEKLDNLVFIPIADWYGEDGFTYNGLDSTGHAENVTNVTMVLTISLPVINTITKIGDKDTTMIFNAGDFVTSFNDTSCGILKEVKIISLPSHGILKFSDIPIAAGQEIIASNLDDLTLVPDEGWNGNITFRWQAYDGDVYSNTANVTVVLISHNDEEPRIIDGSLLKKATIGLLIVGGVILAL